MSETRLPQEQPGCRSILVRLIFRPTKESRPWPPRRPLRLLVTFTRTKKVHAQEAFDS
ncbi:MAG TPA: hypothetical protein VL485_13795 [Ktedonobacteraceae bacterium]|jgi:hypothetical protein|nr:hypothetical protein [Ktedonobacteraceae bacterium]